MILRYITNLALIVLFLSCTSKDMVEIVNFLPEGEVEKTTNFTI